MGTQSTWDCSSVLALIGLKVYRISTMKFLVVLALFAAASAEPEAEADPWYYYTHGAAAYHPYTYGAAYGYGYPYYQYVLPTVKAAEEKAEEPVVEAKAAEVKPVVYTHPYLYGGIHYPYAYNYAPVAHTVVKPYTYYANVVEPSILSRNVKPKLNQKPKPIQMLGMDMDTDTDHTGDTEDTDLLTIIHTHMDTMVDTMVDTVDTTTENRLLQYKYRILPTGCGYLKNKTKNINKMSKKRKHISILN